MTETTRLTDADRRLAAQARELTEVLHGGVDAWRRHTGKTDLLGVMTDMLGDAMVRLEGMVALVARLDGPVPDEEGEENG
jgi:hypothetical protein